MTTTAPLGLLLDVDGPIASPVSRTVAIPTILDDLVTLASLGVPIAFITGRSDAFIAEVVIEPLLAAGLGDALAASGVGMFGVFEKGAVWAEIGAAGLGSISVDESLALPREVADAVRALVAAEFSDSMFFDETKRAMISVEQHTHVPSERYLSEQKRFDAAMVEVARAHGIGLRWGTEQITDAAGLVPFRIDPTIISTDVESVVLDKDRGAERALEFFAARGVTAEAWRSMGDSRSDYKMADFVHAQGLPVAHVDVRPADGVLVKPYEVITIGDLVHDEAGAAFLREQVARL